MNKDSWQLIDSAPEDGTLVQVAYRMAEDETEYEVTVGFSHGDFWQVAWDRTNPPQWHTVGKGELEFWAPLLPSPTNEH